MYIIFIAVLSYELYLWVVFMYLTYRFLKKSIYICIEYLLTAFCHYHYMIMAVIHAITLFSVYDCSIA